MTRSETKTQAFPIRANPVARLIIFALQSLTRRRDRLLLGRLDDHLLRDIGLSPDEAETECAKPFWRP